MDRRNLAAVAVALAVLTVPGAALASGPGAGGGSAPSSTHVLTDGRVIDTFHQDGVEVRTIGPSALSSLAITTTELGSDKTGPHGSLSIGSIGGTFTKSGLASAEGPKPSPVSAVDQLIALGVDPAIAERDFGDFDRPNGVASSGMTLASYQVPTPNPAATPAITPSSTVPWQTRCYTWNGSGGHVYGNACSSAYVVSASGTDWYLQNKFKATAWSDDTSLLPLRIKKLNGYISWVSGNSVYDWDPSSTEYRNSCGNVTFGIAKVGSVSVTVQLCPNKIVPYKITSTSSGAEWQGNEVDTDPEGVAGWQAVHSPSGAAATWDTGFYVAW